MTFVLETLSLPKRDNDLFYNRLISLMDEIMKILKDFNAFQSNFFFLSCLFIRGRYQKA